MQFEERFDTLDPAVWTASYLPAWSSRTEARATYQTGRDGLSLTIPPEQRLWCPDLHPTPLRVSAVQSVNRSGPVGSSDAPQPFGDGLTVREEQPSVVGFAPHFGTIEVTCSAHVTPRSMFSAWMVGLEDRPERSGEICLMEIFGNTIRADRAGVGQGIHRFRDPALAEEFTVDDLAIDAEQPHTYEVGWRPGRVEFTIDGHLTRTLSQAPDYPMMLFLGLFDFPDQPGDPADVPSLRVTRVRGRDLGPGSSGARLTQ